MNYTYYIIYIMYPAAVGRHFDLSCCSRMTFRAILLLQDDMSAYPAALGQDFDHPAALGQHLDVSCCIGTTFRRILCSGTTFRRILLLWEDISTYPAAPG